MPKKKEDLFPKELARSRTVQDWLAETLEDTSAKCKLCKKVFKPSNMVADALKSHADSERHKQEIKNLQAI